MADGNRVYVTLGYDAPVTALEAATGKVIRTYEGTEGADEIAFSQGILFLCIRKNSAEQAGRRSGQAGPESILAVNADTGEALWQKQAEKILPLSLAIEADRVFFHTYTEIVCLDLRTGEEAWRAPSEAPGGGPWAAAATLVAHDGVVLLASPKKLEALSAETGRTLWTGPGGKGPGVANPPDLFVADGLVWCGAHRVGHDPTTGQVKRKVEIQNLITPGHHFRCYRSKATERYLLWPKRGVEFIDLKSDNHMRHDWLRAPCKLGFMPCNGLLYVPPHQCFCYPGAKVTGFNALASERKPSSTRAAGEVPNRLEKGPAYVHGGAKRSVTENPGDWPTYRHDPKRGGSTTSPVPPNVDRVWQAELGGRITPPVVVGGKLFVALVDAHSVCCLDTERGARLWNYTSGGRVDSPPTVHRGLVLFGSADGWVYCLRSSDGELVWRFRAAPEDRRVVAFGQLESAWPVHGSVLVKDDVAYFAAGRSSYLDGGIYLYGLEPKTGKVLHKGRLDGPHPDVAKDIGRPFDVEGAFSDVLVTDGQFLYMQQAMFDSTLAEQQAPRITKMGDRKVGRHLLATAGFLDDSWWNRTFWMYSERWPGYYIANQAPKAGQLLVFDATTTYGVKCYTTRNRHSPMFFPGKQGYLLFADDNDNEPVLVDQTRKPKPVKWLPEVSEAIGHDLYAPAVDKDKGTGFTRAHAPKWSLWVPVRVRAMVLADETLFVAGPPDVLDPDDPLGAFEGRKGAVLWAVSAGDGKKIAEHKLDSPPVFDGMIAANGRLYVSTRDGRVVCMGRNRSKGTES